MQSLKPHDLSLRWQYSSSRRNQILTYWDDIQDGQMPQALDEANGMVANKRHRQCIGHLQQDKLGGREPGSLCT